jgi:hypothetical protein
MFFAASNKEEEHVWARMKLYGVESLCSIVRTSWMQVASCYLKTRETMRARRQSSISVNAFMPP